MTPASYLYSAAICLSFAAFVDRYQPRVNWYAVYCVLVVSVTIGVMWSVM